MESLYPFLLEARMVERPWGGRNLATRLNKTLPDGQIIGESWEIDPDSKIANGPLAGRTLRAALQEFGGRIGPQDHGEFPLLVKFLDAHEWLSVQVHPDDVQARLLENQPRGKTECWYILAAEPGAKIAYGTSHSLTAERFREAIAAGKAQDMLAYVPVAAGDFIFVPATTPHAIGPGILLYELQQYSDTTYRVYDWDRVGTDGKPRSLHVDKALAVMDLQPRSVVTAVPDDQADSEGNQVAVLIRGTYFGLDRLRVTAAEATYTPGGTCHLMTVIAGTVWVDDVLISKGHSALIPAGLARYTLRPGPSEEKPEVLRAWPAIRSG